MSLLIKKQGILTTVQDLGRVGFQRFGINPNGVMDPTAARLVNLILGNAEKEAVLEMHFPAGEIVFEEDMFFSLGGAKFGAALGEKQVENWKVTHAKKHDVLSFTQKLSGNRSYLAIKNGFNFDKWLGSSSTNLTANFGGFNGRKLKKGDRIDLRSNPVTTQNDFPKERISNSLLPVYSHFPTVRVLAGAEYELLTAFSQQMFLTESFDVSNDSNRMGYRLLGKPLYPLYVKELISSAVTFGTVQLLPNGRIIVLMADHQTSGGYPRIANVIGPDLPLIAQLGPGDKAAFQLVSIEEAEDLTLQLERDINLLKAGCGLGH